MIRVLDLFSAAAGGWSLGMHRAGLQTMAACEVVGWRRALYSENNPGVPVYDDVTTLTADRLIRDGHGLPDIVVGSPPCQDISSANTKGKGVEGKRSSLYFDAVRIVGECRPRWFAFENSSNLRTRGADAVLAALEALGYACWPFVVRAGDIGANHERPRCWIIGCDLEQVADASKAERWALALDRSDRDWEAGKWIKGANRHPEHAETCRKNAANANGVGRYDEWSGRRSGLYLSLSDDLGHANGQLSTERFSAAADEGSNAFGARRLRPDANDQRGDILSSEREPADADQAGQAGQADGCMVASIRQAQIADDGRCAGRCDDGSITRQVGLCEGDRIDPASWRSDWSLDDLAAHLQLDDGLSSWVAGTRIAVGGPRGTSAASLIVEAFGDAVVPQIPEAIGLAILRTERALAEIYGRNAA